MKNMSKTISGIVALLLLGAFPIAGFAAGAPAVTTLAASNVGSTTVTLNGYFNANGAPSSTWFKYGTSVNSLTSSTSPVSVGSGSGQFNAAVTSLSPNTTYYFRAEGSNFYGSTTNASIIQFTTGAAQTNSISVVTLAQSNVTGTTATLNGHYTISGANGTLWFKYGTSQANMSQLTNTTSYGAGNANYSASLSNLQPSTTYYFQAMGMQAGQIVTASSVIQFTTTAAPASSFGVTTLAQTNVTYNSANLNAYITMTGTTATSRYFKWGTSMSLNNTLVVAGPQTTSGIFTGALSGLTPNTTYYFKAYSVSSQGVTVAGTSTIQFTTPSGPQQVYACSDGVDNDSDGLVDIQDPGCSGPTDNSEYNTPPPPPPQIYVCNDGYDNDYDGLTDFPSDPGCTAATDNSEYNNPPVTYICSDGNDNDNDGLIDFPQDPGCSSATDTSEYNVPPQIYVCSDSYDNDGDGLVDSQDPGCSSPTDNDEYNYVQPPAVYICSDNMDNDNDGLIDFPQDPGCSSATDNDEYNFIQPPTVYACNDNLDNDSDGLIDSQDPGCAASYDNDESNIIVNNGSVPTVTTNPASNVYQTGATLNGTISANNSPTYSWFEYGTNGSLGSSTQQMSNGTFSGNISQSIGNLTVNTNYSFRACASNSYGSACGSVLTFATLAAPCSTNCNPCTTNCNPCTTGCNAGGLPIVNTSSASNVTDTSAVIYGFVNPNAQGNAHVWFKFGPNGTLAFTATPNPDTISTPSNISAFLSNLQANTVYSFQACASNQNGQNCGNVLSFITTNTNAYVPVPPICQGSCGNQPPIIIYTNTGGDDYSVGTSSLATLKLTSSVRNAMRDETITYTVTLENKSNRKLKNIEMHVSAPADLAITSTSLGELSFATNTVTVKFASLAAGASKTFTITARINKNTSAKSFVVHADASYLNTNTDQRETVTAELMTGVTRMGLFAGAFSAGFSGGLAWFLIGLLIILLLVLFFSRERHVREVHGVRETREVPLPPSKWPGAPNK